MFEKIHTGRIINLFINIFLGFALVLVALGMAGALEPMLVVQNVIVSVCVGFTVCDLLPAGAWGERVTRRLGIKNPLAFHIVSVMLTGTVLIPCISLTCQFVAFGSTVMSVWLPCLPYLLLTGYAVLILFMPVSKKIAALLTK